MACPFFLPMEKLENGAWLHASRLPLGCGWSGHCTAPGHEGTTPSHEELHEFCNLGYAQRCGRFPKDRPWDSVRFNARSTGDSNGNRRQIQVRYVCERDHRPAEDGFLEFDASDRHCAKPHADARIQRMAECFLEACVANRKRDLNVES